MNSNKDCETRREAIAALVLGELESKAADDLKEHIATCETCRSFYEALTDEEEVIRSAFATIADRGESIGDNIVEGVGKELGRPSRRTIRFRLRTIMESRITKLAAAAVIIIAVFFVLHFAGGPDMASVAWGELVERVEQSHDEYMKKLLLAVEEKDTEKVEFYADLLSEFWQNLGWLAETKLHPERRDRIFADVAIAKAHYEGREESDQIGVQLFLEYEDQFSEWLGNIADVDVAWINETVHVCKQMEEYAEEIRDVGRHPELDFSYAEHCLPSFVSYCEWFEQLPWDNPEQYMSPAMLLTGIERDLEIARWEIEALEIRGVIRFVNRCVQQAQKNAVDLDKKTASSRTKKQRNLCRQLTRRIDELCALITYAEIARWDFIEQIINQKQYNPAEKYDQVLTEEFGNKGPFADYYIERIDQSLDLCEQLLQELEPNQ